MKMKARYIFLIIVVIVLLTAVGVFIYERAHVSFHSDENGTTVSIIGGADGPTSVFIAGKLGGEDTMTYKQISMDEAKQIFESGGADSYIILDVRTSDEFADGHIPGAINVANESIGAESPVELADKNQLIYVYCRSGNRSKQAAEKLVALGYTNIVEFGGIIDWTGEIEK
ncbi:MAG: rhodanese-like domain-containing protein [Lachnospiraceae bacterium]|nr:rhodanese-like domain-containing protein [Lachnospiraceae bacterium]